MTRRNFLKGVVAGVLVAVGYRPTPPVKTIQVADNPDMHSGRWKRQYEFIAREIGVDFKVGKV